MKLKFVCATGTNPYENIAMEEYLTFHTQEDEVILYLWQNANTVVIGKNQNSFRECKVSKLLEDGGFLARRLSGGGAVYHDLGNLNFTFCVRKDAYDVDKQLKVIEEGLKTFGLLVEKTGRNDLAIDGKKFSGNAFYASGVYAYHHGTIMVEVNERSLTDYLTVSAAKLKAKGVDSVRSRVVNLRQLCPQMCIDELKNALKTAFATVYQNEVSAYELPKEAKEEIAKRAAFFASKEWLYDTQKNFAIQKEKKFSWGEVVVNLETDKDRIVDVKVFSDALDEQFPKEMEAFLRGKCFQKSELMQSLPTENKKVDEAVFWILQEI